MEEAADHQALTDWTPPLFCCEEGVATRPLAQDQNQQSGPSHDIIGTGPPLLDVIADSPTSWYSPSPGNSPQLLRTT